MNAEYKMIPVAKPCIGKEESEAVRNLFEETGCLSGTCEEVRKFEREFAKYVGSKHAIATSSCTTALHTCCIALDVNSKTKVAVPAYTHPATINAPMYCGCRLGNIEIVDVSWFSWNMDYTTETMHRSDVVIPVHCFGNPLNLCYMKEYAAEIGTYIIEDAACAVASTCNGKHTGTIGDFGCYSFYPIKEICTGEGGMIVTDDSELAELSRKIIDFGKGDKHEFQMVGYNYRMSAISAAIGRVQLRKLPDMHRKRKNIAKIYDDLIANVNGVYRQQIHKNCDHSYQRYSIVIYGSDYDRGTIQTKLNYIGIETTIGTYDLTALDIYNHTENKEKSNWIYNNSISLPMYPDLTEEEAKKVCAELKNILR